MAAAGLAALGRMAKKIETMAGTVGAIAPTRVCGSHLVIWVDRRWSAQTVHDLA